MQVIAAFLILAALAGGLFTAHIAPKNEYLFFTGTNEKQVRIRTDMSPLTAIQFHDVIRQHYDYSCGSAALATLLKYGLGEDLTEKQVIYGMLKYGDIAQIERLRAFSLYDMQSFCHALGYTAQGYRAKLKELENPEYWPCIVPIRFYGYRHFVVLKGVYGGHVFVADPFRGNSSYTLPEFKKMWYENVIFLISANPAKINGCGRMRLSNKDLRYIRDDTARDMILNTPQPFKLPPEFDMRDIPGEWQYSRSPD